MAESEKTLAQRWMDLLGEEGYRPHLEQNEDQPERNRIAFKSEGTKVTVDLEDRSVYFNIEGFGEQLPSAAMFERSVGQCAYAADRFFTRLREAKRSVVLAS